MKVRKLFIATAIVCLVSFGAGTANADWSILVKPQLTLAQANGANTFVWASPLNLLPSFFFLAATNDPRCSNLLDTAAANRTTVLLQNLQDGTSCAASGSVRSCSGLVQNCWHVPNG